MERLLIISICFFGSIPFLFALSLIYLGFSYLVSDIRLRKFRTKKETRKSILFDISFIILVSLVIFFAVVLIIGTFRGEI